MTRPALRGALIGCGFFASNHLHAWHALEGVCIVATCDVDATRARRAADDFGIAAAYDDAARLLDEQALDFVDIVTTPATHRELVELAASRGVHTICQKPIASSLADARAMVNACERAGVRFMVHENFRWQSPMRALHRAAEELGALFFGRISFRSGWDVYAAQPYLATDERFILSDLGVHLLDLARFFFGEVERLTCVTTRVNRRILGEDVATLLLRTGGGAAVVVDMSYASVPEKELFPQTLVQLEGAAGTATLGPDYHLTVTGPNGTQQRTVAPIWQPWHSPRVDAIQESVLAIQRHWLECLRAGCAPETSGADNLRTLELVLGAYESAATGLPFTTHGSLARA